ncbi:MAG: hypothetical protein GXP33_04640 [Spirochaetes bacterium]|nr:hypothetical protein [Spirochaetota bacterium]
MREEKKLKLGIFPENVDGRQHLEQFEKMSPFGKPVFIDKPFATSIEDAKRIVKLSEKFNTPFYSCSSIRYVRGINELAPGKKRYLWQRGVEHYDNRCT